jgi:hypothetical protein
MSTRTFDLSLGEIVFRLENWYIFNLDGCVDFALHSLEK